MTDSEPTPPPTPIADLHCHYPMHFLAQDREVQRHLPKRPGRASPENITLEYVVRVRRQPGWVAKLRAALILLVAKRMNFSNFESTWRVDLEKLARGGVRIVCSVLFLPFAEIDDSDHDGDFDELLKRLCEVETELEKEPEATRPIAVKSEGDLDTAIKQKRIAIIHCVEGGFYLGRQKDCVAGRIRDLATHGVGYITLAHLFYRGVATNAPAFPMLTDRQYDCLFHQPEDEGLSPIGEAAVRAMYDQHVLIDVSHMRGDALTETFELLKHLDRRNGANPEDYPVIATHAGFRFGDLSYMLDAAAIREIAARKGVIGLIMARHQLNNGLGVGASGNDEERTIRTICSHIDAIRDITGSNDHVAVGSDLDGFIKPTLSGIENVDDLAKLRGPLRDVYGDDAELFLWKNGEGVLRKAFAPRN
jgi:microsomal dipeptidase-like Zn-dependent dipeptidase